MMMSGSSSNLLSGGNGPSVIMGPGSIHNSTSLSSSSSSLSSSMMTSISSMSSSLLPSLSSSQQQQQLQQQSTLALSIANLPTIPAPSSQLTHSQIWEQHFYNFSPIETKDEFDEKLCRAYSFLHNIFNNNKLSELQAHEEIYKMASQNMNYYEDITMGYIVSILLDESNAQKYFRDIIHINRDGLNCFNYILNHIIVEKYFRLHEYPRVMLLWLLKELLRTQTVGVDLIYMNIFRNIIGGDLTPKNLWLTEVLLDILIENRQFYEMNRELLSFAAYNYLRLIVDHTSAPGLRSKEIQYCYGLLCGHFSKLIWIGRDLVRLLQHVTPIPEFDRFWKDSLLSNPGNLAHGFTGIVQLMKTRTPRRFLKLRITHEMEKKLNFFLSSVRFGRQPRYQDWFQKQYFSTPESQMLRTDVIRFICCCIHPSNEIIASDVLSRWATIGWLLNNCTSNVAAAYSKLALYYDWLFFDALDVNNNSVMDIEPGILIITLSLRSYPNITSTLLDFLCRISKEFYPACTNLVRQGIKNALYHVREKRVVMPSTLANLFESPKIDFDLRQMLRENFPEFCVDPVPQSQTSSAMSPLSPLSQQQSQILGGPGPGLQRTVSPSSSIVIPPSSAFGLSGQSPSGMIGPGGQYIVSMDGSIPPSMNHIQHHHQQQFMPITSPSSSDINPLSSGSPLKPQGGSSSSFLNCASFSDDEDDIPVVVPVVSSSSLSLSNTTTSSQSSTIGGSGSGGSSGSGGPSAPKKLKKSKSFNGNNQKSGGGSTSSNLHSSSSSSQISSFSNLHHNLINSPNLTTSNSATTSSVVTSSNSIQDSGLHQPHGTTSVLIAGVNSSSSSSSANISNNNVSEQDFINKIINNSANNGGGGGNGSGTNRSYLIGSTSSGSLSSSSASASLSSSSSTLIPTTIVLNSSSQSGGSPFSISTFDGGSPSGGGGGVGVGSPFDLLHSNSNNGAGTGGAPNVSNMILFNENSNSYDSSIVESLLNCGPNQPIGLGQSDPSGGVNNNNCLNNNVNNSGSGSGNSIVNNSTLTSNELLEQIEHFPNSAMKTYLLKLHEETNREIRCQLIEKLIKLLMEDDGSGKSDDEDEREDFYTSLTVLLLQILESEIAKRIFPYRQSKPYSATSPDEAELRESINGPLFVMFREMCAEDDPDSDQQPPNRVALRNLIAQMGTNSSEIGYLLIYYLVVTKRTEGRMQVYRDYIRLMGKELQPAIHNDLRSCSNHDIHMFGYLVPVFFANFFTQVGNNAEILYLVLSNADAVQMQSFVGHILSGTFRFFRKDGVMNILNASLEWDTIEQLFLWKILEAQNTPIEQIIPILPKLVYNTHSELLTGLMLYLYRETPTTLLIKHLLNREPKPGDNFTVSILLNWADNHSDKLCQLIGNFFSSKISSPNKNTRNKRNMSQTSKTSANHTTNVENFLIYLDQMRQMSKNLNFLSQKGMMDVIRQLRQHCSSSQKTKYGGLFELCSESEDDDSEEDEKPSGGSGGGGGTSGNSGSTSSGTTNQSSSSSGGGSSSTSTTTTRKGGNNNKKGNKRNNNSSNSNSNTNNNIDSETESESSGDDVPQSKGRSIASTRKKRKQPIASDSD